MALRVAGDGKVSQAGDAHEQAPRAGVDLRVGVVHEHGSVRIRPVGDVDLAGIGYLRARTNEALAAGADRVILDLRATTFLDSTGLHLAVELDAWARRNGIAFAILAGPRGVQRAFDAAGLGAQLPFVDAAPDRASASG
jgi:anti-anti-sigma factor